MSVAAVDAQRARDKGALANTVGDLLGGQMSLISARCMYLLWINDASGGRLRSSGLSTRCSSLSPWSFSLSTWRVCLSLRCFWSRSMLYADRVAVHKDIQRGFWFLVLMQCIQLVRVLFGPVTLFWLQSVLVYLCSLICPVHLVRLTTIKFTSIWISDNFLVKSMLISTTLNKIIVVVLL